MARDRKTLTYRVQRLPLHIDEKGLVEILQENLAKKDDVPAIRVFSLARNLDAPVQARSKVATVTIDPSPQVLEGRQEWFFKTRYDGVEYHIIVDLHFLDFTVLNEVSDEEHAFE
ncbi:hypothetical protein BFW01_g11730 [Lasiodiplodia theobromae]|nr:hypothetical protein BFW01_g11730 [Lasiodiplodia theobromae]